MSNEFLVKNGLISQGNIDVTGNLVISQNITATKISASLFNGVLTGSVFGTSSWATNAQTASSINFTASNSTLAQTASSLIVSNNYIINNLTASNISASATGSFARLNATNVSASLFNGVLTGSVFGTSSWATNTLTASSLVAANNYSVTNLSASNNITASTLYVKNNITSSNGGILIDNLQTQNAFSVVSAGQDAWVLHNGSAGDSLLLTSSGQIKVGNLQNATTNANGGLNVLGGISVVKDVYVGGKIIATSYTGSLTGSHTGSVFGTASWATNTLTASSLISSSTYTVNTLNAITSLSSSRVIVAGTSSTDTDAITRGYIVSRGQNLFTNGFGNLSSTYNFTALGVPGFDAADTFTGGGSVTSSTYITMISNEYMPVNTQLPYRGTFYAKSGDASGTRYTASNRVYGGIACYDIDLNRIDPVHVYRYAGSTDTTLYSQLNVGDTSMIVTNTTGWYNSTIATNRYMTWYPYSSSKGYVYDNYTYSRNITSTVVSSGSFYANNGLWASGSITQSVGSSSITLTAPWPGPVLPAGTPVRNSLDAGTYKYPFALNQFVTSSIWTKFTGVVSGLDANGIDSGSSFNVFRPATAFVRMMWYPNYLLPADANVQRFSAVTFGAEADPSGSAYVVGGNAVTANAILGTSNNYSLQLGTNNVVRMTISSSGNVGIGVNNPVNKLDVVGNISASVITASGATIGGVSSNNTLSINGNTAIGSSYYNTIGPANGLIVQGNVGFGVANPFNKLDVAGNISASYITASGVTGIVSTGYAATSSLSSGSFIIMESATNAILYYRTTNGTLRSASLN